MVSNRIRTRVLVNLLIEKKNSIAMPPKKTLGSGLGSGFEREEEQRQSSKSHPCDRGQEARNSSTEEYSPGGKIQSFQRRPTAIQYLGREVETIVGP